MKKKKKGQLSTISVLLNLVLSAMLDSLWKLNFSLQGRNYALELCLRN